MIVYLVVGEASGDNIGAKLMRELKMLNSNIEFHGIGGPKMQAEGVHLLFPSKEISFMGFLEILPHIFSIFKRIKQTINHIIEINPDILVTIDAPGFCFRVAEKVKGKLKGKLVHYVAPTVWAYKPERAKQIAKIYDHLLCILPFESEYFLKEGLDTSFIGHPAIEDLKIYPKEEFRKKHNISKDSLLLCLTPGSRKQEVETLLPIFLEAIEIFKESYKRGVTIIVPTHEHLKALFNNHPSVHLIDESEKQELFSAADIALTKSGTITTELAFYKIPMIVAHKVNSLSYWLIKSMIKVKFATIINILAGKEIIPELLQDKCNPKNIAAQLNILSEEKNYQETQKEIEFYLKKLQISGKSPSKLAAEKLLDLV
ncbi:MAG: lipid-A-disaccharide synthase [Pseudomonadota bacterium]